jgi:hypothetical protein
LKRPAIDVIKRGLANVLANWPLLLIRIAEAMVFLAVIVVSVVAMVVPVAISIGLSKFDPRDVDSAAALGQALLGHWPIILFLLVGVTLVFGVLIAIHSFVQGASSRIYLDGERRAGGVLAVPPRAHFAAFAPERWFAGGAAAWWSIFWIYNIAWTIVMAIVLLPLLAVLAIVVGGQAAAPAIVAGCALLVLTGLFFVALAIVTSVWTIKAMVIAVDRGLGAPTALSAAWTAFRGDAGRNLIVLVVLFVLMVGGGGLLGGLSAGFSFTHRLPSVALMLLPAQIVVSLVQSIFSSFMDSWLMASFAALEAE